MRLSHKSCLLKQFTFCIEQVIRNPQIAYMPFLGIEKISFWKEESNLIFKFIFYSSTSYSVVLLPSIIFVFNSELEVSRANAILD